MHIECSLFVKIRDRSHHLIKRRALCSLVKFNKGSHTSSNLNKIFTSFVEDESDEPKNLRKAYLENLQRASRESRLLSRVLCIMSLHRELGERIP